MQNDSDWMTRYYSLGAQAKIAEKAASFTPEMQAEISDAWKQYYRDLNRWNQEEDPDGTKAAKLAKRHTELLQPSPGMIQKSKLV
jgi:TipAS antibiotic-recognition domain